MRRTIILNVLLMLSCSQLLGQEFSKYFKQVDNKDGLSQITVNSLLQDRNGFIWAGTQDGLNRYDGNEFVIFRSNAKDSTTLSNDFIKQLIEDQNGNIWVVTQAGGVCKYNPRTNRFRRYKKDVNSNRSRISDNVINAIYMDNEHHIWVAHKNGLDLYNVTSDAFQPFVIENSKPLNINALDSDKNGNLWLGTNTGLKLLNIASRKIEKQFRYNSNEPNTISSDLVLQVSIDQNGSIWTILPEHIINNINPQSGKVTRYFQKGSKKLAAYNPLTRSLHQSRSGKIWLATELQGLVIFDPKTGEIQSPYEESVRTDDFSDYQATCILEDNVGSFWVGTLGNGILHYDINANPFGYRPNIFNSPNNLRTDSFSNIYEDQEGFIWLSSIKKGLSRLNPVSNEMTDFDFITKALGIEPSELRVQDITQDSKGIIWLGTRNNGFIKLDPNTNKFKVYDNVLNENNKTGYDSFHIVKETSDGLIWLASKGALSTFIPETETAISLSYKPNDDKALPGNIVSAIYEDPEGDLWIGFYASGLFKLNRKTGVFTEIKYEPKNVFDPDSKLVSYIFQNQKNIIWIGTTRGLFKYNLNSKTSVQYTSEYGLANNTIYDILDDDEGNLWLSTNEGVSKFNPKTETFKNYNAEDGLQQSEFNFQAGCKSTRSGLFYFGGTKGFNVFNPKAIKDNTNIPLIKFAEFFKYDEDGKAFKIPGINYLERIKLPYDEKDFSVKIAALDYTNPSKNKYAYWLEGYNNNWMETGIKNEINFTNLSPGNYILKVKGSNNVGRWNEVGKTLKITVLPPWWGSWPAYSLYAMVFIGLLFAGYRYRMNQLETLRLKELDKAKKMMYTNITHEFRTPLTVISGITKELRDRSEGKDSDYYDLIDRNTQNMLYLVNQLLELRKLEIGKMNVNYVQNDIISYLKYIIECFKTYAETRDITVHFLCILEKLFMDYDPDKLFMIMSNLISNAIKYSKPGGDVFIQIDALSEKLRIRIVDSGNGIPEHQLPHIFERFYKVENKGGDDIDGVGIGLAVTKELVELLNGEIKVSSKIDKGSIFAFTLPIHNDAPLSETKPVKANEVLAATKIPVGVNKLTNTSITESAEALNLLIIEDNQDIVTYLETFLSSHWNLEIARDGKKGITTAIEKVPDIILCDLMMPNVSGYEVLKELKNDSRTSHIPIVILTAKADDDSRIKAYKMGADAYLLKPFNKEELLIILKNLVEHRRTLQERYKTPSSATFIDGIEIKKEDIFIKKLEELVLHSNTNRSFSVSRLCDELAMSRTQLHNKVKALTGKSTSIFVRSLRLQKGKHLLKHTSKSISEIAYEVGFNNPSYFSKSFTEEFGYPPSTIKNK
jgi:signal transduction histidine kinase/ligand-binding sensor domain-containing protein/DNA-binding response OmpR family regulator